MFKSLTAIALLLISLNLTGCMVPEGRYLKKMAEADRLSLDQLTLQKQHDDLTAKNSALRLLLESMTAELAVVSEEKSRLAESVARHALERTDIEKDLKSSPGEAQQRISELRQQLSELEAREQKQKDQLLAMERSASRVESKDENLARSTSDLYELLLEKVKSEISLGKVGLSELKGKISVVIPAANLFVSGGVDMSREGVALMERVAAAVRTSRGRRVAVEGHTDNLPAKLAFIAGYPANWELSALRAVTIARQLQQHGVSPQDLSAAAFSEYRPLTSNEKKDGRDKNDRIEIHLEPAGL